MAERGRPKAPLTLTDDERQTLQRWARRAKTAQALALRARIVLACAEGRDQPGGRRAAGGLAADGDQVAGPVRAPAAGRPVGRAPPGRGPARSPTSRSRQVIVKTLEEPPPTQDTHWSTRSMARATGMSQTAVSRIWRAFGLKPHLVETFKLSTDPQFIEKVRDVVGLYLDPPDGGAGAVRRREDPDPGAGPHPADAADAGRPPRRGAPTTTSATAPPACSRRWTWPPARSSASVHRRHRHQEFLKFLKTIDARGARRAGRAPDLRQLRHPQDPGDQDLAGSRHPRFHLHFTPTCGSWLNLVERWFAELTTRKLRRCSPSQRHRA